jgi:hypothetical protein
MLISPNAGREHRISDFEAILVSNSSTAKVRSPTTPYAGESETMETARYTRQIQVDRSRSQADRNILGQFSTPFPLAVEIIDLTRNHLTADTISFLEPAVGTGVFFSALKDSATHPIETAVGVEIDAEYAKIARDMWQPPFKVVHEDYFRFSECPEVFARFNCLCANPPYVRHHHMDGELKRVLQQRVEKEVGIRISGLSGLYIYFILLSHRLLADGAVASWLIPSEFMSVNYGRALREYLIHHVTLLQVHQFNPVDVQFDDALVSSCVITYRNKRPKRPYSFHFSSGGALCDPSEKRTVLSDAPALMGKWNVETLDAEPDEAVVKIGDLFEIKRGIATGANEFFIIDRGTIEKYDIPRRFLKPLLPSPRYLASDVIEDEGNGDPAIERRRYLLDCDIPPEEVRTFHPGLWAYLQEGKNRGVSDCYICSHRKIWYQQERRNPPLFLTTYMGRSNKKRANPFRFILNKSKTIATNVYIYLYPKTSLRALLVDDPDRIDFLHRLLNQLDPENLIRNGRTYGGGLHKLEPKELASLPLPDIPDWLHIEKATQTLLRLT